MTEYHPKNLNAFPTKALGMSIKYFIPVLENGNPDGYIRVQNVEYFSPEKVIINLCIIFKQVYLKK